MSGSQGVHLIGSVPLADTQSVFRTVIAELGPWLKRIPDGETGERHRWIYWQREMLLKHPAMELDPDTPPLELKQWDGTLIRKTELVRFRRGTDPRKVEFETGYAPAAIDSYRVFKRLREEGVIPHGMRFQVALPTPMASGYMYVSPAALAEYLIAYERALMRSLRDILGAISHVDLSIQWDICQEVLVYESYFPHRPANYKEEITAELGRLGNAVPANVELGFHLCYGTPKDEHLVMPRDTAVLTELANGFVPLLRRRLDFLHLPVPKNRTDAAYIEPLRTLQLPRETALYLGLIHFDDHAGDLQRLQAAKLSWPNFGCSSECGWGRTDPQRLPGLLRSHRLLMEATQSR